MTIKVGYLLMNEALWKPLIRRQVIDLVVHIQSLESPVRVRIISVFPWHWYLKHGKQIKECKKEYARQDIDISFCPIPVPFPVPQLFPQYINNVGIRPRGGSGSYIQQFLRLVAFPVLWMCYGFYGIKIFHARGYPATDALLYFKRKCPVVKIIFDPRSAFPEENLYNYNNRHPVKEFTYWKKKEFYMLNECDNTVCISEVYKSHFQQYSRKLQAVIIPNNVDTDLFYYNSSERESIRKAEGLEGRIVFGYLGTMYPHTWHQPHVYAEFIFNLRASNINFKVLFLVPETNGKFVSTELERLGVKSDEFLIIHPQYHEVPSYLSACDFGLFYLSQKKIALSIKVVEYLAVGLPVLVNKNCDGAIGMLLSEGLGGEVQLGVGGADKEFGQISEAHLAAINNIHTRDERADIARKKYSNTVIASKYVSLYKLLNSGGRSF